MSIDNLMKEIVEDARKKVELSVIDQGDIKRIAKETIIDAFKCADFKGLLKQLIRDSMKDVEIINPVMVDKEIKDVRIITETKESQEVNDKMKALSDQFQALTELVKSFDYADEVKKAVKKGTEDVHIKNAIVTDVDVTNAVITEERHTIPKIEEKVKIEYKTETIPKYVTREEFITIKKLVFPDGREAV